MEGCECEMKDYCIPESGICITEGSSDGTQIKYFYDGKWFKQDANGYEGLTEYVVSCVLECSNIDDFVRYEQCKINGKDGCLSESFLSEGESFYTFERLHKMFKGRNMVDEVMMLSDVESRIRYVVKFLNDAINLDCSRYISDITALDALILNPDRHFNNLGVIYNENTNIYRTAPVFDNGAALLSNTLRFPFYNTIEDNISSVVGQPFCAKLELQAYYAGIKLRIDYNRLYRQYLDLMPNSRCIDVLKYQIENCRKLIPEMNGEV